MKLLSFHHFIFHYFFVNRLLSINLSIFLVDPLLNNRFGSSSTGLFLSRLVRMELIKL